jgi:tetratricopeptide (TPR) repeat protein
LGNLDKVLIYQDRALKLLEESISKDDQIELNQVNTMSLIISQLNIYSSVIGIAIDRGDIELAKNYFGRLESLYSKCTKEEFITNQYKYNKARLLKASMRARDRAEAEKLYKEIIKSKSVLGFHRIKALIRLCELLIIELRITSDMDVLEEIKPMLEKLINLAQQRKSDLYLTKAYILQAKLALLIFDIKSARRILIQAQRIAERRGYLTFAKEIDHLHENLKSKLGKWENLKMKNAPLFERIELAELEERNIDLFEERTLYIERVAEKEVVVYKDSKICLVCKGNVGGFDIYVCPECNSIYCKDCAQAIIKIENICWTCEKFIDESKPVKLHEFDHEELKISDKNPRNPK